MSNKLLFDKRNAGVAINVRSDEAELLQWIRVWQQWSDWRLDYMFQRVSAA